MAGRTSTDGSIDHERHVRGVSGHGITGRAERAGRRRRARRAVLGAVLVVGATSGLDTLAGPSGSTRAGSPPGAHATGNADEAARAESPSSRDASTVALAEPSGGTTAFRPFLEPALPADVGAAVGRQLDIAGLLRPEGIARPHWRSFDHVRPLPTPPRRVDGERFVVAIDPGHGGSDPGAEGPNGLLEKHLTLDIARRVRLFLSELDDIDVVLTRERDRGLSRRSRVAAVRGSGADLFVSLHFNHLPQSDVTLVESYYAGPENIAESRERRRAAADDAGHRHVAAAAETALTRGSARFASLVQHRVHDEVSRHNDAAENAGVKRETLFVLTRSFTSGALVELTCLSNHEEAERLTDESYRDRLAAALADAIRDYRASLDTRPLVGTGA